MSTILTVGPADGTPLQNVLAAAGYRVVHTESAEEALRCVRAQPPDLVLVDGRLPATVAADLVARVRAEPAAAAVRIVLLGSTPDPEPRAVLDIVRGTIDAGAPDTESASQPGDQRYRALFENSISGIALHEILTDASGRPTDYVFLDVNPAFEKLTGLRREQVLGRRVTEVLPGIEAEPFIETYGRVALNGEAVRFEQFAAPLGRHYDIAAFPWGRRRFAVVFTDITERRVAEERLRLQGAALEAAANAIVITDREGRITWTNPAFTRLTGWGREEVRGQNPRILKSGSHDLSFYEEMWRTLLSGRVWQGEMVNRRKDGNLYVEEQTITPVRCERGEITHFIAVKVDVSERRAAREALLRSERWYRTLAEAAHDFIFIVGREGRIGYVNTAAAARFGRRPDEVVGKRLNEVFPVEIAARFRNNVARVLASGEDLYAEERTVFGEGETWIGTWLAPLEGEGKEIESVVGISRDITVRVRAEQALKASEERYRSLFERNLAGVYRTTLDGRILECNDAFARIFGFGAGAEVRGLGAAELYPQPAARQAFLERLRAEGALVNYESEGRTRDGASVWVLENASLVQENAPGAPYIEGTIVDLSEHKRLEQQLRQAQKIEAIGQLAGGVAHDFNNILNVISGYSELALRRVDKRDPVRRYLEEIRVGASRAAGLTRQLLAFSRRQILEPIVLDVDEVLRGLESMLRRLIREDIELVTTLRAAPALVKADRGQVEQVVMNLAVNARDALPEGGRLTIETAPAELDEVFCRQHVGARPGPYVMLAVSDTGIGMDAETRSHIFEPFFTTKEPGKGTGLGLSTVYGIVKQAGGSIWVYSEPGQGATFKVYLPRAEEVVAAPRPPTPPAEPPGGTETILLVEDEEALRTLTRELLESLGYTVLEARHGVEALELSARLESRIDLLVTDVVMPEMSGQELAARLGDARPEMQVLFVSGYTEDGVTRHGLPAGRVAFLQKPFTSEALARRIRRLLDGPRGS
ncbi:MAG: hypothetical protein A2V74_07105 [Acidobacteria bacterium RBG_16_70_10]|nr:MAG: hypothetical protein A2V74_07105 [Acidobacteria bacterium RBG_16_70_10]